MRRWYAYEITEQGLVPVPRDGLPGARRPATDADRVAGPQEAGPVPLPPGAAALRRGSGRTRSACAWTSTARASCSTTTPAAVVRTRLVSALDVAHALAGGLDLASGVLPPGALWWARTAAGERTAVWREPRVWTVRLRERYRRPAPAPAPADARPRLRLPAGAPGALRLRRQGPAPETGGRALPLPDLQRLPHGRVCTGSHLFPADPARVPEEFFRSHFSATADTARGKSRRHPEDVGALWAELDGRDAFPLDDLVPALRVADAFRVGA